ncbi:MAG: DMT family transporter [Bacteroidetes bacterium]|nr:DMT family transporter [Bacteroidota bacterium]
MNTRSRDLYLLHFVVFIWGWTAILGKLIELPALYLVWYRLPIAVAGIAFWAWYKKINILISWKKVITYSAVGLVIMLHWITFYGAIKVSNISITLACLATISFFTSILEPLIFKRRIRAYEIIFGLIVAVSMALLFKLEFSYKLGIAMGIFSAFTSSLFGVLNGWLIKRGDDPVTISFFELAGGLLALTLFLFKDIGSWPLPTELDWFYLALLGILCTTIPFIISMEILRNISPYTIALTINLETVYGIFFAYFIFNDSEKMSTGFYLVTAIVLAVVIANALLKYATDKRLSKK